MNPPAIYFTWDGHAMLPLDRFSRLAEQSFTSGHAYRMIVDEERSSASHRQYFAAVREAWLNLPEELAFDFPTSDHLRKWALIRAGFCSEIIHPCDSEAEAVRTRKLAKELDTYAVVKRVGQVVHVYVAKSQSYRNMSKREFQESKTAVLDILAGLLNVTADELKTAGIAA